MSLVQEAIEAAEVVETTMDEDDAMDRVAVAEGRGRMGSPNDRRLLERLVERAAHEAA